MARYQGNPDPLAGEMAWLNWERGKDPSKRQPLVCDSECDAISA